MLAPPSPLLRVAVVDNFDYVRDGVVADLRARPESFAEPTAHTTTEEVFALPEPPDVVVLDLHLGRDDTLSTPAIPDLVARGSVVVLYTSEERPAQLRAAVAAGAAGLALKNDGREAMLDLVLRAARGEFDCSSVLARALVTDPLLAPYLTERQVEVLGCLNDGLTRQQVGRRLGISLDTVGDHLKDVRRKYADVQRDVTNTGSLLRHVTRDGYLD
ncbi:response regulator transcription factor [Nocardioides korecus]